MRLLHDEGHGNLKLVEHHDAEIPLYAILSHTWDAEEVTFKDLMDGTGKNKTGYQKIEFCRKQAACDGLQYFWVDTCCINKSSDAELTESINSMFRWYQNAARCYVYLSDVLTSGDTASHQATTWKTAFRKSRWFRRGWTLQELIAPALVEFFSREGDRLGSKASLEQDIHEITGIAIGALRGGPLKDFKVEERLAWAEHRETTRQEDKAYSLLGIFGIRMSLQYGEGREEAFIRLQRKIKKSLHLPMDSEKLPSPLSTVPFRRDVDFVDRRPVHGSDTLVEHVNRQCATPAARVALIGIGGAGKSQLAIEYCYRLRERSPETWVFWIHASNVDRVKQGYREIAEQAQIPGRDDPKENIFSLVARWLQDKTKGPWLLVLDNLDDDTILSAPEAIMLKAQSSNTDGPLQRPLSAYLPQSEHGAILITTRTRSIAMKLVEPRDIIPVEPMTNQDAMTLLKKRLDQPVDSDDLGELVYILEYMPLAIIQAAAYIQQKGARFSVRQYISLFQSSEKQQTSLLNYEAGYLRRDSEAKNSIIITWQISFNEIRERCPSSADLLSLMSYFDRQGIPEEVLKVQLREDKIRDPVNEKSGVDSEEFEDIADSNISDAERDNVFEEAVTRLQDYSFVSIGGKRGTLEMHGLVQLATRKWLEMNEEGERWKALLSRKLNTVFPDGLYENWGWCEVLFPHVKSAERQRPAEIRHLRDWAQILRKAGWYTLARGDYGEARRMCEKSVGVLRKAFGEGDVETSYSLGLLAAIYLSQGRWKDAENIGVQVMATMRRVLGDEHPDTLTSMANLASIYRKQGRWIDAERIGVQVMGTERRVLGDKHPDTLTSMANLASTYRKQGRWTEAEKIEVQVMETSRRVLGDEHPDTLTSMANLASTYRKQGRWTEAEKIGVQVMETSRRVLGDEHPNTLTSIADQASTYGNQGRWSEAEKIGVLEMETSRRVLGDEHPSTLTSMNNLALIYGNQGRWTEAEKIEVQVLETSRKVLGDEHPNTLTSLSNLALTYGNQGRWTEAEKIEVQLMETKRRVLGDEHPSTLTSMSNMVSTYGNQGQWTEAEKIGVQVMETSRKVLGDEHPNTLISIANLASIYKNQGRWTEAEKIEVQVMETSRRVLGDEHPNTLTSMANLASTYLDQGRWTEAEKIGVLVMRRVGECWETSIPPR